MLLGRRNYTELVAERSAYGRGAKLATKRENATLARTADISQETSCLDGPRVPMPSCHH